MAREELEKKAENWCLNHTFADTDSAEGIRLQNAYIAGAIENGIQWHNLRKDPNDLPDPYIPVQNQNGERVCYEVRGKKGMWRYDDADQYICRESPVAWCEIPHFEE